MSICMKLTFANEQKFTAKNLAANTAALGSKQAGKPAQKRWLVV